MRFDAAYHGLLECNLRRLADDPALSAYLGRVLAVPGVADTVSLEPIKRGCYEIRDLNPSGGVHAAVTSRAAARRGGSSVLTSQGDGKGEATREPGDRAERIPALDEATRPIAPPIPGATPAHRSRSRRLSLFHQHHLRELAAARDALRRFMAGEGTANGAAETFAGMTMAENSRRFGTLCGRQCLDLQFHHDVEQGSIFPALRRDEGLGPVLDRLEAEHRIVSALLERILSILRSGASDRDGEPIGALAAAYEALERTVVSHFRYEEAELEEALGFYGAI